MNRACALLLLALAGCDRASESPAAGCPATPIDPVSDAPADTGFPRPVVAPDDCALHDHTWPRASLEGHELGRTPRAPQAITLASGRVVTLVRERKLAVYDPSADRFTFIALPDTTPLDRAWGLNQVVWAGAERALVFGGYGCKGSSCGSTGWAVLVDVATGDITDVTNPDHKFGFVEPAVLLSNGQVLIASEQGIVTFDPTSRAWTTTDALVSSYTRAVVLLDGRVMLLEGGNDGRAVAIYDPPTMRVLKAAPMGSAHYEAPAVRLRDGRVLVAGGRSSTTDMDRASAAVEIYDPWTDTWKSRAPLPEPAHWSAGILLGCGGVAVVGGLDDGRRVPQPAPDRTLHAEIDRAWVYSPSKNEWTSIPLQVPRRSSAIARLADGTALVLGGLGSQEAAWSVEWIR